MPNPFKLERPQNAKAPFQILNIDNANEPARINVYDTIGESWWDDGITGKQFANEIKALGKQRVLDVYISSNGGDVMDGTVMYNALLQHQGTVNIIIDGWAISMASVLAMAGDSVKMSSIGMMMIHKPLNWCGGNANDMRKNADMLDKVEGALSKAYINKTGLSETEIATMLDAETWMTAEDALAKGFIDEIIEEPGTAITNSFNENNISAYKNVPASVIAALAETSQETDKSTDDIDSNALEEETDLVDADTDDNTSNELEEAIDPIDETIIEEPVVIDPIVAERARNKSIMAACRAAGKPHLSENYIDKGYALATVQDLLSEIKAGQEEQAPAAISSQTPVGKATSSWDDAYIKAGMKTK